MIIDMIFNIIFNTLIGLVMKMKLSLDSLFLDINECAVDNGGCTEVCENTDGSFFCACDGDEKALSSDGKSCVGTCSFDKSLSMLRSCSRKTCRCMIEHAYMCVYVYVFDV